MLFNDCSSFVEQGRCYIPYYLLIVFTLFVITLPANFVVAFHEFDAFRMGQYDLHGVPYGKVNAETFHILMKVVLQ